MPPQLRSVGQHWLLTQTSTLPGLQHLPPQTGAVNWQHSPDLASAHDESSSQQTLPQTFFCRQHLPLWLTWPCGQQIPFEQISLALSQQKLPHSVSSVVQPQVPSGPQLLISVPQQAPLQRAAPAGQQRLPF